jgi:TadE-like protein
MPAKTMIGGRRWKPAEERGVALVEFALVLPLVLLLLFGMIDAGKAINYWNDETHLANEGARYASVNKCAGCGGQKLNDWIKSRADSAELRNGSSGSVTPPGVSVCIYFPNAPSGTPPPSSYAIGQPLKVVVRAQYNWLGYLVGQGIRAHSDLVATSTMRIEQAPTAPTDASSSDAYVAASNNSC